jgi:hypothetical protein
MTTSSRLAFALALGLLSPGIITACATNYPARPTLGSCSPACQQAAAMMVGSFSSKAQAQSDPDFRDIRLHMAPIWQGQRDACWLYVEQAAAEALDKPYRQRIYKVRDGAQGSIVSEVYELPGDPLAFAGAWGEPTRFDALSPATLSRKDGCDVVLRPIRAGAFSGGTEGTGCVSTLRGASYATSKVHLDASGLVSWDQGWNDKGEQVWGATKAGYIFLRDREPTSASPR